MPKSAKNSSLRVHFGAGSALAALFLLAGCAVSQASTVLALSDNSIVLSPPGEEQVSRSGQIVVGDSISGKYLAARHAEIENDFALAADLLLGVLEEVPDDARLLQRAHLLLASEGRSQEALVLAERLVAINEASPFANIVLALKEVRDGDFTAAGAWLDAIERTGTNQLLAPMLSAWALYGAGRTDDALAALEPLGEVNGFAVLEGLHSGLIADLAGREQEAEKAFERANSNGAIPLRLALAQASFFSRLGRWADAEAALEAFRVQQADDFLLRPSVDALAQQQAVPRTVTSPAEGMAEALVSVARALNRDGGDISALVYVRLALELKPGDAMMQTLLADILANQTRWEDSIAVLRQIDEESPYSWFARRSLAQMLEATGAFDEAVLLLQQMVGERLDRVEAAQTLGDFLRLNDRFDEAVDAYDVAVERVADIDQRHWRLLYTRGIALERSKDWQRAEKDFLKALELQPQQPLVLNYLGYSWVEKGLNLDRARRMIEDAVAQRPGDGFIVDSMGWVLYQLGDYEGAVTQLERAVSLESGDPIINDHLGDAYWLVGRNNEARFQWNRALGSDPEEELEVIINEKLQGRSLPEPTPVGERDS